jgi:hypothetical protein
MSQEKTAEDLQAFLKRIEDMARQRNLNIFMLAESRDPQAKQKSGKVTLNLGMSRQIREANRWHDRFRKQTEGMKKASYEDGRSAILESAGIQLSD